MAVLIAAAVGATNHQPGHTVGIGTAATSTTEAATTTRSPSTPTSMSTTVVSATTALTTPATTSAPTGDASTICHLRGTGLYVLPDPACTPGATNPEVSQADVASTICAPGWTATIRPPESYTEPLKIEQMAAYAETESIGSYEEDHLISLELGGSPTDRRNLWPEPGASPNPKDAVENAAREAVCDGRMPLVTAQQRIAGNWIALGQELGVTTTGSPVTTPATAATTAPSPDSAPGPPAGGCFPKTAGGRCYKAGEYCSDADHGMTGTDADGNAITCKDINGTWRWE